MYSLERVPTINVLSKTKKNLKFTIFCLKIIIFTDVKNCCIFHGRVCVMYSDENNSDEPFSLSVGQ